MAVGVGASVVVVLLGVGNSVVWGSAIGTAPESVTIITKVTMNDFIVN